MALAAGCEASPLLFSCFHRAVGRSKRQSCRVTMYGTCFEKIGSERLNETVSFEGDLRCSRRSPSKLTVSLNLSERILLGQTPHAATLKVYSLDQQPLSIKIKRSGARTLGQWLLF